MYFHLVWRTQSQLTQRAKGLGVESLDQLAESVCNSCRHTCCHIAFRAATAAAKASTEAGTALDIGPAADIFHLPLTHLPLIASGGLQTLVTTLEKGWDRGREGGIEGAGVRECKRILPPCCLLVAFDLQLPWAAKSWQMKTTKSPRVLCAVRFHNKLTYNKETGLLGACTSSFIASAYKKSCRIQRMQNYNIAQIYLGLGPGPSPVHNVIRYR